MIAYSVFLASGVVELLPGLKLRERTQLMRLFNRFRSDPFVEGDYTERDDIGRLMQVLVVGRHAIVFWVDHAVKEVKVLDLRPAGS